MLLCGCPLIGPGIPGSGTIKRETREVQPFNRVSISGAANFEIQCGQPSASCEVECDDNLLEHLATTVEGGELKIHFVKNVSPSQSLRVLLATEHLSKIAGSGSVSGKVEGLDEPFTEINMSGSAKIQCSGKAEKLEIHGSGSTAFECRELAADDVVVNISGSGKASVNADRTLKVAISGSGSVRYLGTPQVEKSISGSGSIKPIE
jgi:Putative auto-transporter adhesin, head GIN domain